MTTKTRIGLRAGVLVVFALVSLAIFLLLLNVAGGLNVSSSYNLESVVPTAVQLVPGADVREAGVNVGKVTAISNRGDTAVVEMALDRKYGPVYHDGTVRVRTKTLVGENYVDVNPGTPSTGAIASGGVLPISQAQDAVQLDQLLSTLDAPRRARLQALLHGVGGGLRGESAQLNQTFDALSSAVGSAAPVAQALDDQSQHLASLVDDLGQVFTALGDRAADIRLLADAGTRTATILAGRPTAVREALRELPPTLTQARVTTAHLASVGADATPVLDDLGASLRTLTPTLRILPAAGRSTVSALDRLHAVTPVARRLLSSLKAAAPVAEAVVPPLDRLVGQLLPAVGYLAPYAADVAHLLTVIDSAGSGHDATGYLAKLVPVFAAQSLTMLTPQEQKMVQVLESLGATQALTFKGLNNYPAPGTADHPAPLSTRYPHVR
jgi:phospholipid/cholesterol/gamma-HCH transport system substrate-binding protein